jgi:hypothetical protein
MRFTDYNESGKSDMVDLEDQIEQAIDKFPELTIAETVGVLEIIKSRLLAMLNKP